MSTRFLMIVVMLVGGIGLLSACSTDKRRKKRFELNMKKDAAQADNTDGLDLDGDGVADDDGSGGGVDPDKLVIDADLIGKWESDCSIRYSTDGEEVGMGRAKVEFLDSGFVTVEMEAFSESLDEECAESDLVTKAKAKSFYKAENGEIEMILAKLEVAVFDPVNIETLNNQIQCGWNDWNVSKAGGEEFYKEVTLRTCSRFPGKSSKRFDRYEVSGDELKFGISLIDDQPDEDDKSALGRSPESRPSELNEDFVLTRK